MRAPRPAAAPRSRTLGLLTALSIVAVVVHLWGLYRVTGPPSPPWFPNADKLQHLLGFGLPVLVILLMLDAYARRRGARAGRREIGWVAGLFALHAIVSEVVQHVAYVTRSGDPVDAVFDVVGVALGVTAYRLWARRS